MNRRGFLQACLATATAPYVVTSSGVLMPVRTLTTVNLPYIQEYLGPYIYRWVGIERIAMYQQAGWEIEDPNRSAFGGCALVRIPSGL